ncbi:MAG: hypothetical protein HY899_13815 [Deltaproteobacteria bacterium]|nr:hypothetical protein [Deltaproteobacteria bacterium]
MSEDGNALREAVLALGVARERVERAEAEGTLELVALEHLVANEEPRFDLTEAAAEAGLGADRILAFWRALGFPDPRPKERLFTAADVSMLAAVVHFIDVGALDQTLALQMARVVGSSLNRIAAAQVDAVEGQSAGRSDGASHAGVTGQSTTDAPVAASSAVLRSAHVVPLMPSILENVWRRHLATAARRRIVRATAEQGERVCVGFADLVGFTAQTRELPNHQLAEVVGRFETIAYDVVTAHGGRVVKLIGDEVLFMADDVRNGVELALALTDAYRRDEYFSDVRVALASGRVLERDGDVFGAVVNLASRIVHVAFPGSVVVSEDVHSALEHDPRFVFRNLRQHSLKDIGRVQLWSLRAADLPGEESSESELRRIETDAAPLAPLHEQPPPRPGNDSETARRLRELEAEARRLADQSDATTGSTLAEALHDTRIRVEELEAQAHQRIEDALLEAERVARRAGEQALRKVAQVIEAAQRTVDAARAEILRRAGLQDTDDD